MLDLAGLGQRERLEELIEGAEAAGEDDETTRVLDEHVLADEEIAELDAQVDVPVHRLLVRQLDVASNGQTTCFVATAVDGLHDSGAAARDYRKAAVCERNAELATGLVVGIVVLGPCGAENRDRRPDVIEGVETLDELREDSQNAPRVGVVTELLDRAAFEQRAVGGGLLAGDDQATGASAVSGVPAVRVVHQAPAVFGFGFATSEAPLVVTTAASGSSVALRSPFEAATCTGTSTAGSCSTSFSSLTTLAMD